MAGLDFPWPFPDPPIRAWEHHGVLCAVRHLRPLPGWIAGYVRLPTGHPWAGSPDHTIHVDVHGGISYVEHADQVCWIGFDTMCINQPRGRSRELATWTEEEAVAETEHLAEQVAAAQRLT